MNFIWFFHLGAWPPCPPPRLRPFVHMKICRIAGITTSSNYGGYSSLLPLSICSFFLHLLRDFLRSIFFTSLDPGYLWFTSTINEGTNYFFSFSFYSSWSIHCNYDHCYLFSHFWTRVYHEVLTGEWGGGGIQIFIKPNFHKIFFLMLMSSNLVKAQNFPHSFMFHRYLCCSLELTQYSPTATVRSTRQIMFGVKKRVFIWHPASSVRTSDNYLLVGSCCRGSL